MSVPLSVKATLPPGDPNAGSERETVAVYVIVCPVTDGFAEEVVVTLVDAAFTTCASSFEVLTVKSASPLYVAVSSCVAAISNGMTHVAVPAAKGWLVHAVMGLPPSLKLTVPVGDPVLGATTETAAMSVTV
jgi:hypothetical protein